MEDDMLIGSRIKQTVVTDKAQEEGDQLMFYVVYLCSYYNTIEFVSRNVIAVDKFIHLWHLCV
jgi:hypothetical protein